MENMLIFQKKKKKKKFSWLWLQECFINYMLIYDGSS